MYLKKYQAGLENRRGSTHDLYLRAETAASAFSELHSISHSQDASNSAVRLACESLLWLRDWQVDRQMLENRDADLARKGLQQGVLPNAPPPEQSEAYAILARFGENPSASFAPRSIWEDDVFDRERYHPVKVKECETSSCFSMTLVPPPYLDGLGRRRGR
jgi:hypothetical protein